MGLLAGVTLCWAAVRLVQRPAAVMRPLFVYGATRVAGVLYRASPQIEPGFNFALAGATRPVALLLSPIDAEAFENGTSLGTMPLTLQVPVGQKVAIVVKRDGYWSRAVLIDDTRALRTVRLHPILGAASTQVAPELEDPDLDALNGQVAQEEPEALLASEESVASPEASTKTAVRAESSSASAKTDKGEAQGASSVGADAQPSPASTSLEQSAAPKKPDPGSVDEPHLAAPAATASEPSQAEADASASPPGASPAPPEAESDAEPSDEIPTEPGSGPQTSPETPAPTDSGE